MYVRIAIMLLALVLVGESLMAQSTLPAAFVTNNVGDSVTSFTINPDGTLNFVSVTDSGEGPQCIALTPDGKYLAVGHGTINEVVEELRIFEVHSDATLSELLVDLIPNSPLDAVWLNNEILAVTETSLSGDNNLITYHFDSTNLSVTQVDSEFTGTFSYSIALDRKQSRAFTNNTFGDASIAAMSFDAAGTLTTNETQTVEPLFAVHVSISPDGEFLYGSGGISGTGNEVFAFSIDGNGLLDPIAGAQSPGSSPKVIDMTADGTILVAGHGTDSTVQSFQRDTETGLILPTGFMYDVGSQGNLGDLIVIGDLLLVTDESTTDDGVRGLLSLRINPDGSLAVLSPAVDTQGSRPEYIAAWPGDQVLLGDINLDGVVDLLDVSPFVALITSSKFQAEGDIDGDGVVGLLDVQPFVDILTSN